MVGAQAQHVAERRRRLAIAALLEQHAAERLVHGGGAGRARHRGSRLGLGVGGAAQAAKDDDEVEAGRQIVGPLRERLEERGGRIRELAAPHLRARTGARRLEVTHRRRRRQRPRRGRSKIAATM